MGDPKYTHSKKARALQATLPKCAKCKELIYPGVNRTNLDGKLYHSNCLPMMLRNNEPDIPDAPAPVGLVDDPPRDTTPEPTYNPPESPSSHHGGGGESGGGGASSSWDSSDSSSSSDSGSSSCDSGGDGGGGGGGGD